MAEPDARPAALAPLSGEGENDPYAVVDRAAEIAWERAAEAIARGEWHRIPDETVARLMTAALKLYAAKADAEGRTPRPLLPPGEATVTATEALTVATELLRALRLGPMEFGLWARRRPEDWHARPHEPPPPPPTES